MNIKIVIIIKNVIFKSYDSFYFILACDGYFHIVEKCVYIFIYNGIFLQHAASSPVCIQVWR